MRSRTSLLRVLTGRCTDDSHPVRLEGPDRSVDTRLLRQRCELLVERRIEVRLQFRHENRLLLADQMIAYATNCIGKLVAHAKKFPPGRGRARRTTRRQIDARDSGDVDTWRALLDAHSTLMRQLDTDLAARSVCL